MLLSLLQSPVADPESEALARKVSCKLSLHRPGEVSWGGARRGWGGWGGWCWACLQNPPGECMHGHVLHKASLAEGADGD